jgi:hypothetical protein
MARSGRAAPSLAVVVPAYRATLTPDERVALDHLDRHLAGHDTFLLMPDGLDVPGLDYRPVRFPSRCFADVKAYSRLMLDPALFARFESYEYILIHQLDALVLDSDVGRFLSLGLDYIGAPWVEYDERGAPFLAGVGNGGLSLRRVETFRRLLTSRIRPGAYYRDGYADASPGERITGLAKTGLKALGVRASIQYDIADSLGNEDHYLAERARLYDPAFRFASVAQALEFAFEREPAFCLEQAGGRLPWGVHAWGKHDRAFWEPYL